MVFRKSKLFEMAAKSSDGRAMNMDRHDISQLNSYVISASIAGRKLSGLKEKVRTIFKPLKVSKMERVKPEEEAINVVQKKQVISLKANIMYQK